MTYILRNIANGWTVCCETFPDRLAETFCETLGEALAVIKRHVAGTVAGDDPCLHPSTKPYEHEGIMHTSKDR
jgi:hypothetical protein